MPTKKTSAGSTPSTPSTSPAAPRAPKRQAKASNGNGNGELTALPAIASASDRKTALSHEPTREQIAEAAYLRYLERGGSHGQDFNDWLEAERELKSRLR